MNSSKVKTFLSKNVVAVVMIPTIIGLHWGWNAMQHNEKLVDPATRIELPPIVVSIEYNLINSYPI